MKISIMQPTFCPWTGYFAMIKSVDIMVLLDCVQFERRSWQSRNRIKVQDKEHFISLSLQKAPQKTLIKNMRLLNENKWKNTLLKTIYHAYNKTPNFGTLYEILEKALFKFENLSELNIFLIKEFCQILRLKTPIILASTLNLDGFKRERLLLEICKNLGANEYLSPEGSKVYLQKEEAILLFKNAGVKVEYFDFTHPKYTQQGSDFVPYLSVIDLLFNEKSPWEILANSFENENLKNAFKNSDFDDNKSQNLAANMQNWGFAF